MTRTPTTLADLIALQAQRTPGAPAILAPDRAPLAYAALVAQIERTIASLRVAGFARHARIAICLPNGPEMAVALLALIGGATCVPFNPALDEASYRAALATLHVDALVVPSGADTPAANAAKALGVALLRLAFSAADAAGVFTLASDTPRTPAAETPARDEDVGLVLQTSGTTAAPKAVPLTHRNLTGPALTRAHHLQITATDRCLSMVPLYNSGIRRWLFPALATGASIVCTPGFVADALARWFETFEPTLYMGVPALQRAVLDTVERGARSRLRLILSGGAPLPHELEAALEAAFGVPIVQTYAMSETGAIAQTPLPPARRVRASVGPPAGSEVRIRGDDGAFLAPGGIGEIVVRGPEVFGGYENNPEANARAFVDGWFRTGDLGYLDDDGYIHIVGRANEIINRGGQKVSPAAVDAAMMRHPEVVEAATFAVAHASLGEDVVTAAVVREPARVGGQDLRAFAFDNLAAFMVPSQVLLVSTLPRSAAGKVQRAELARLLHERLHAAYRAPRDEGERRVAEIFAQVLGVEQVGAFHHFFELGGDSLRGAQVVVRASEAFGRALDVASLFRHPTVAEFAAAITRAKATAAPFGSIAPLPRDQYRREAPDAAPKR